MIAPDFPKVDKERKGRIISDVISLLKLVKTSEQEEIISRWCAHTLNKATKSSRLPWWFASRLFACKIYPGQDVFELQGNNKLDGIIGAYCSQKMIVKPISYILECRSSSYTGKKANRGEPVVYSQYGGRLHLWPAPDKEMPFIISYTVPITTEIIPDSWESILVDGIIGLYGRHFDKSGLLESASEFRDRFYLALKNERAICSFDSHPIERHMSVSANSFGDSISNAWMEINSSSYENEIIKPSYSGRHGNMQIRPNLDVIEHSAHGQSFAQIPGDNQP